MKNECARDAYHKLMRTAYELSLHPTLSTKQFKTFVNVLRINGVRLVEGNVTYYELTSGMK